MARVMFAEVCDRCGTRGPEYDASFVGSDPHCDRAICADCTARVLIEHDETQNEVLCLDCHHAWALAGGKPCAECNWGIRNPELAETEPELCAACAVDEAEHHAEVVRDLIEDDFLKHRGRD